MTETRNAMDRLLEDLQRQREELELQMHLGKAEAKAEWQELEKKWREVKPKLDAAGSEAAKTGENVLAGLQLTLEELGKGYERIRNRLR
jgi:hypothetical protein